MNKRTVTIVVIVIAIIAISSIIVKVSKDGFWHMGTWYDTPEEALAHEADMDGESMGVLSVKALIYKVEIDDITEMTFVSQDDTLVSVTFVTNEKGRYSVYGYTEEVSLSSPSEFVVAGAEDQSILFPYSTYGDTVYGWCFTDVNVLVNGAVPSKNVYEFECQGATRALCFWRISGIDAEKNDTVDVTFERK